jgi:hypothetical protein
VEGLVLELVLDRLALRDVVHRHHDPAEVGVVEEVDEASAHPQEPSVDASHAELRLEHPGGALHATLEHGVDCVEVGLVHIGEQVLPHEARLVVADERSECAGIVEDHSVGVHDGHRVRGVGGERSRVPLLGVEATLGCSVGSHQEQRPGHRQADQQRRGHCERHGVRVCPVQVADDLDRARHEQREEPDERPGLAGPCRPNSFGLDDGCAAGVEDGEREGHAAEEPPDIEPRDDLSLGRGDRVDEVGGEPARNAAAEEQRGSTSQPSGHKGPQDQGEQDGVEHGVQAPHEVRERRRRRVAHEVLEAELPLDEQRDDGHGADVDPHLRVTAQGRPRQQDPHERHREGDVGAQPGKVGDRDVVGAPAAPEEDLPHDVARRREEDADGDATGDAGLHAATGSAPGHDGGPRSDGQIGPVAQAALRGEPVHRYEGEARDQRQAHAGAHPSRRRERFGDARAGSHLTTIRHPSPKRHGPIGTT